MHKDESVMTATELKDLGNKYFTMRKFSDAVKCYSSAISKNPSVATYFTNRALSHIKLKQYETACQDCKRSLELDSSSVKGHYFSGQALLELANYDEAIASLTRAHDLAKEQKLNFGDDIAFALRVAKKKRWSVSEEKRVQQEIELQTFINKLINDEKDREISKLGDSKTEEAVEKIETNFQKQLHRTNDLFALVDDRRRKRDVPDFLCGKISFELMNDPVITPSGISYDRKDIEEHLQRVGHFDPVTRTDLRQDQLIPNLALKEVIDHFLEENPWAEDY